MDAAPNPAIRSEAGADGEALTHYVADFVQRTNLADLPPAVIESGKKSILDGLGLALSGSVAKSGELVRRHLAELNLDAGSATTIGSSYSVSVDKSGGLVRGYVTELNLSVGPATVIGSSLRVAPRFAAFANGVGIHADDYDDTQLAVAKDRVYGLLTHPTAPALPAALAVGEAKGASGSEVMLAYHLGVEVECKIAEAINPRHYQSGFHSTATCGTFAAAAAAGRLMGLSQEALQRALSIAGSQSAGLRENFGTMTKPFHAGRSSESGVVAAQFASYGWTATDKILEAPRGFFSAAGGGYDVNAIAGKLGAPWTFEMPGISIKPHPSGSLTHPGMTEMLRLIREHGIKAENVCACSRRHQLQHAERADSPPAGQ